MMIKKVVCGFLFTSSFFMTAEPLSFVDEAFGDFLKRIVPQSEHERFVNYYTKFSEMLMEKQNEITQEGHLKRAMAYLKKYEPEWFEAVSGCITTARSQGDQGEPEIKKLQMFLSRYGAYRDFLVLRSRMVSKDLPECADKSFDSFMERFVALDQREIFKDYYARLTKELALSDERRKKETFRYLQAQALNVLKEEHPNHFAQIAGYLSNKKIDAIAANQDPNLETAYRFLRRYGAYQEFQKLERSMLTAETAPKESHQGVFSQISAFFSSIGTTVAGWLGLGKKSVA